MNQNPRIYRVSELANEMRNLLEMSYASVWIEGELSTLSKPASGHIYFTIKDDEAQIRCAMFRNQAQRLPFSPSVGEKVKIRGKLSVYTARGDLQCIAQSMEKAGEGELNKAFELLKQKLLELGLFDRANKKSLPEYPKNIGIVSSASAAALQDIITTLKRRCPGIPVTLYPSLVQGDNAAPQLVDAIKLANQAQVSDVIILARGGGSLEDLWGFNDETLAHTISESKIPIISAVGHEVDFTIADFVADLRAPTPTAAAELVAPDVDNLMQKLFSIRQRAVRQTVRRIETHAQMVDAMQYRLIHPSTKIENNRQQLQALAQIMSRNMQQVSSQRKQNLQQLGRRLNPQLISERVTLRRSDLNRAGSSLLKAVHDQTQRRNDQLSNISESLNVVNPLATLERGYSITRDEHNEIVRKASFKLIGTTISIQLGEGRLECDVKEISE
ncbi:MAG: exodeoxyribonuclease VII large subunit [Arenicella sp.]|nr:exodeoxyribonuclease VII large subunit [Arenicella sp.]